MNCVGASVDWDAAFAAAQSLALTLLCGWLLGDFISGVLHWWEDRYCRESWPIVGRLVCAVNLEHHRNPAATAQLSYFVRNREIMAVCLPAAVVAAWLQLWTLVVALLTMSQAFEVHAWAHARRGPIIRAAQAIGLCSCPRCHAQHHRRPYATDYCVVTCWLNPVLDHVGFWRGCEWLAATVLRAKVNPDRATA